MAGKALAAGCAALLASTLCGAQSSDVTQVDSAAALQRAVLSGAAHIRITKHLDLRELEYDYICPGAEDCEPKILFKIQPTTLSITGDCSSSYKLDLDKDVYSELVPPLATPRNRQCVLLTRDRLFQVSRKNSGTWFDQLLVRLVWPTQELHNLDAITVKLPNFINMMGADNAVAWYTNVTYQGDSGGASRAMDAWEQASLYFADCAFVDIYGDDGPAVSANSGSDVYYDNCIFHNLFAADSGQIWIESNADARILVEDARFGDTTRALAMQTATSGEYVTDKPYPVFESSAQVSSASTVVNPAARKRFVNPDDPQYTVLRKELGNPDALHTPSPADEADYIEGGEPITPSPAAPSVSQPGSRARLATPVPDRRRCEVTGECAPIPDDGLTIVEPPGPGPTVIIKPPSEDTDVTSNTTGSSSDKEASMSLGAIIGAVVGGAALVVALLAVCAVLLVVRGKRSRGAHKANEQPIGLSFSAPQPDKQVPLPPTHAYYSGHPQQPYASLSMHSGSAYEPSAYGPPSACSYNGGHRRPHSHRTPHGPVDTLGATLAAGAQRSLQAKDVSMQSSVVSWCQDVDDALDEMRDLNAPFMNKYEILGPMERRAGGQGVVQFMRRIQDGASFAAKFYTQRDAYDSEVKLYLNPALQPLMPARHEMLSNDDEFLRSPSGFVFPPCIVLEKGESLDEFAANVQFEFITVMQALSVVASKLAAMHAAGWAHRDLKPGNVLRMPALHSWTLIDFGCSAPAGTPCSLMFSISYAAPETIQAYERGDEAVSADPAVDMWALGVIAFELLTNTAIFARDENREAAMARIAGHGGPLPWEGSGPDVYARLKLLRRLKGSVLACLDRDPRKRPTAAQLVQTWNRFFDANETAVSGTGSDVANMDLSTFN